MKRTNVALSSNINLTSFYIPVGESAGRGALPTVQGRLWDVWLFTSTLPEPGRKIATYSETMFLVCKFWGVGFRDVLISKCHTSIYIVCAYWRYTYNTYIWKFLFLATLQLNSATSVTSNVCICCLWVGCRYKWGILWWSWVPNHPIIIKPARFSVIPARTGSVVLLGHFFDDPDGSPEFRWNRTKIKGSCTSKVGMAKNGQKQGWAPKNDP